jgi:hypothetical protein
MSFPLLHHIDIGGHLNIAFKMSLSFAKLHHIDKGGHLTQI